ncbi:MAG: aminopeptidase P family protein [Sedimentisphaerales bacterium]|nr:aminopeptidase P family protein [Sedimentisphaerales bacterium]
MIGIKRFVSARLRRCRQAMKHKQLDTLIVLDPADVRYLTGFSGDDSVLIVTRTRSKLVTDSRYLLQVRQECPGLPLALRQGAMEPAVAQALGRPAAGKAVRVGIESEKATVGQHRRYRRAIGRNLRVVESLAAPLRQTKDDWEVAQTRRAIRIAEEAIGALLADNYLDRTERELAARLEYEMSCRESSGPAFPSIVAVAAHAAQPHAIPGRIRWRRNQPILFDWGATVAGYRSDLTRCFVAGRIRPVFAEAYQWVLEAQLAAIEEVKDGATLKQVDAAARNVLQKSPWPVYGHGTGHGLGLYIHEDPFLNERAGGLLRDGMIITIEPGLYLAGKFGIRIEDDVLVTGRGARVLSRLAKDLDSVRR